MFLRNWRALWINEIFLQKNQLLLLSFLGVLPNSKFIL
ncbi:hypothetical protein LEP1GSC132_3000 [Leptospira kirschneri str. 200803703]|uniref:Uncharacterized protein n=1 Tax=Leptospira kirschneri str. 200802841 TaxID=1193047 RepID=A0A828XWU0_9LEPT|nr:hypothetical protein LEP1GSC131_0989 [Leptospira kirschneri str. 200802841]EMJ92588.1 hypothetical protein LEP1GSC198_1050 [Leptospira kirschneri str. JB]EMO67772.1 hypothetical protein LEP1GSC132_3000 [Leptospira kirschneri str. 200803703]EMO74358.1 hypothetical protein LEP1GSC127_4903 [Leptospira kirschneri str. 200801925]